MGGYVMVGCDVHEQTLRRRVKNSAEGRQKMIEELRGRAEAAGGAWRGVVSEAGGFELGLHDDLTGAGSRSRVLAPRVIPRSSKHQQNRNANREVERLLGVRRCHALAGKKPPDIFAAHVETREARQRVRLGLEAGGQLTRWKSQTPWLLNFKDLKRPPPGNGSGVAEGTREQASVAGGGPGD